MLYYKIVFNFINDTSDFKYMCNLFKFMNMFSSIFSLIHIQWKIILHMYMYTHNGVVYEKHTHTNVKRKQNMFKNLQNKVSSIFCGKLIME